MKGELKFAVDKMRCIVSTGNEEQHQTVKLEFNVITSIQSLARVLFWQAKGAPLFLKVGSDQLELDLDVKSVNYQLGLDQAIPPDPNQKPLPETKAEEKAVPGSTPIRTGEAIAGGVHNNIVTGAVEGIVTGTKCENCGYIASKEELDEQGEGLCPACGNPMAMTEEQRKAATEAANKEFDKIKSGSQTAQAPATEKPKRRSRIKKATVPVKAADPGSNHHGSPEQGMEDPVTEASRSRAAAVGLHENGEIHND